MATWVIWCIVLAILGGALLIGWACAVVAGDADGGGQR